MFRHTIILTGFMGTGKTVVGRLLASRISRTFVDTDQLIVERDGRSIEQIFRADGEARFRQMETEVAEELAGRRGLVIATGGHLMLDPLNALLLGQDAIVVCLTSTPAELIERLGQEAPRRPLLDVPDPGRRIRELLAERAEGYSQFLQVDTSGKTPDQVVDEVLAVAERAAAKGSWKTHPTSRLTVHHPNGHYHVVVGRRLLPELARVARLTGPTAIVTDSNVGPLYAHLLSDLQSLDLLTLPAGEAHKTLDTVRLIYERLLTCELDRKGTLVALGGGVVGDVAGFAAATYMRGVQFLPCPTTVLAMVDASIGGKTGVDLPQGKNLVGVFKQPGAVIADLDTLGTLPSEEFASGMAEVVKHALIASPRLFERLEAGEWPLETAARHLGTIADVSTKQQPVMKHPSPVVDDPLSTPYLQTLIVEAILIKRKIVEADPYEMGQRAVLNLGHTFAHALEQASGYQLRHGEAVAMGLVAASRLSAQLGHCPPQLQGRIERLLLRLNLPIRLPAQLRTTAVLRAMRSDKKRESGTQRYVLISHIGRVFVSEDVTDEAVQNCLVALKER